MPEMKSVTDRMWAQKLGLKEIDSELLKDLFELMLITQADYTIFFRELSSVPRELAGLKRSFYSESSQELDESWASWFHRWRDLIVRQGNLEETSHSMKAVNPSITWREWLVAPAYQQAELGEYALIHELQEVFRDPYKELPPHLAEKYDRLRPLSLFNAGGISHYSCSS